MSNPSRLEQIRQATAEAIEKYRARQAAVDSAGPAPRQGDVYLFPGPAPTDLSWVVVAGPSPEGLLFAVPADGHPLAGLTDVVIPDSAPCGPLVLRCGLGLWIHPDELTPERRAGAVDNRYVRRAGRKLAQIAAAELEGTAAQWETESNPDCADWLVEVERSVDTLASALRVKEEELTPRDFSPIVHLARPEPEGAEPQFTMAAASGGALAELDESLARARSESGPPARRVDFLYPGELFLILETDGVAVLYRREADQPPPELHELAGHQRLPAHWQFTPDGTAARAVFAWRDGQVTLQFGRGAQTREVLIHQ